jgi:RES domain-containing protein
LWVKAASLASRRGFRSRPARPAAWFKNPHQLLSAHKFVAIPSAVSVHSWNLIFVASAARGAYRIKLQERFTLDPRLHPPVRS